MGEAVNKRLHIWAICNSSINSHGISTEPHLIGSYHCFCMRPAFRITRVIARSFSSSPWVIVPLQHTNILPIEFPRQSSGSIMEPDKGKSLNYTPKSSIENMRPQTYTARTVKSHFSIGSNPDKVWEDIPYQEFTCLLETFSILSRSQTGAEDKCSLYHIEI